LKTCPNCGHENNENDRFCANCGTRLTPVAPPRKEQPPMSSSQDEDIKAERDTDTPETPPEPSRIPPPVTPTFTPTPPANVWDRPEREPVDDEWKMSDLGPPPRSKRRTWLWIIIAILAFFVLACCGFLFWVGATDSGTQWFSDFATTVSEEATKAAQ